MDASGREGNVANRTEKGTLPGVVTQVILQGAFALELANRIGAHLALIAPDVLVNRFDVILLYVLCFELRKANVTLEGPLGRMNLLKSIL